MIVAIILIVYGASAAQFAVQVPATTTAAAIVPTVMTHLKTEVTPSTSTPRPSMTLKVIAATTMTAVPPTTTSLTIVPTVSIGSPSAVIVSDRLDLCPVDDILLFKVKLSATKQARDSYVYVLPPDTPTSYEARLKMCYTCRKPAGDYGVMAPGRDGQCPKVRFLCTYCASFYEDPSCVPPTFLAERAAAATAVVANRI
ncbi:Aste57867_20871 [Aphanomyces stellatus]|uniref:Aste57867_20871 protein n=1 Tax=Aphanomyces stellatus TaxID=120398 RepID=A0A485LG55_9STRA|nr:hypothetical protein As57867_020803 [Aphanomyces stellatus]VFT97548.1 Aste57867_20871 [Aphanomyces stellatus]